MASCAADSTIWIPLPIPGAMLGILAPGDSVEVEFPEWEEDLLGNPGRVYLLRRISGPVIHDGLHSAVEAEGIGRVLILCYCAEGESRSNFSNREKDLPVRLWQPPNWKPGDRIRLYGEMR